MTPATADRADLSGRSFLDGRFVLRQRLGAGAYGAVYRATESALGREVRDVAVKLTHKRWLSNAEAHDLMQDGFTLARVAAGCTEPDARKHLIHVFEIGIADDLERRAYAVLEFVPGKTLFDHVRDFESGLPLATATRYFRELAAALAACHRLDPPLMHGDLKPDNVLIDRSQTVRLVDFGWSRPIDRLAGYATDPGGCLAYCAPEVLLGRGLAASDLYSLGLIMYEVLCGDGPHLHIPPHRHGDESTHYYDHKLKLTYPPIATMYRGPAGDPELFAAVERCCRFHAHERYADAVELLRALDGESPGPVCEPPKPEPLVTNWRAHAGCLLDAYDYRGCLEFLEASPQADACHAAYRAICLAKLGRWDDVIPCGADAFERAALPPAHRALLRAALLDAARRGGDEFAIAYYESRAATP